MKGYIKIEATTYEGKEGLSFKTDLRDVDYMDRIAVVNGICDALNITPAELKFMAGLIDSDLMEAMIDTSTLKNESVEPQKSKKKFDSDDLVDLLKSMLD